MKLTPKQAGDRAGVSASLIYQLCQERRLPHFRVGGRGKRGKILIDEGDLAAFFEGCRVGGQEEPAEAGGESVPPEPGKKGSPGGFTILDSERLRQAWRNR
jgi:hypothetical protein